MIVGNIKFMYRNNPKTIAFDEGLIKMTINDDYFLSLFNQNHIEVEDIDKSVFDLTLSAERDTLVIEDISLFNKLRIHSFNNTKASFGLLVVKGIETEITGAYIDIFRTECNHIHVSRSLIRSFDYSLQECEAFQQTGIEMARGELIELSYVTIEMFTVYKSVKEVVLKSAKIDRFEMDSIAKNTFDFINITWNTYIEELSVAGNIERLRIKNSIINKIDFKDTFITQLDNKKSDINMVYMLEIDKLDKKNRSAWELLYKSAIHDDNDALYAQAGYEINNFRNEDQSTFSKFGGNILKATIGYGYKPYRAIAFSMIAISLFALIYQVLDYNTFKAINNYKDVTDMIRHYFDMWYLSGTAYTTTGFGDIVPSNPITKILVIFEAMIGVSVLSLFMYSLLNRYGKKQ